MNLAEAARATQGRLAGGATAVAFSGVSTDSRTIAAGELFVALRGERFDGHGFVQQSAQRGAAAALVAHEVKAAAPLPQVVVDDPRLALGRLAADWRSRFALPVVALTGSNGKTTVKEMLAAILGAHCGGREDILATEGNLNNDIGLPLTLLRLRDRHRYAVLEMGMNHAGEIDYLTRLARPGVALVTNAQRAHVGPLGGLEAVARAKGELYAGLGREAIAVVNADDAYAGLWTRLSAARRVVTFGLGERADVRGALEGTQLRLVTPADAFALTFQVPGEHNVRNAVAACAAAFALEIPPHAVQAGLAGFRGIAGRLERRAGRGGAVVIDDTYNANPDSMRAALDVLALEPHRRVFVMGDMAELGESAATLHAEVGAYARERGVDRLLALGAASAEAVRAFGPGAEHFADAAALAAAAEGEAKAGTTILVKGSRSMRMERIAARLAQPGGADAA